MGKKILILQHYGESSGSVVGLIKTVEMLVSHGDDVSIYMPTSNVEVCTRFESTGARVHQLMPNFSVWNYFNGCTTRILSRTFIFPLLRLRKSYIWFKKVFNLENPDIVICNSMVLSWLGFVRRENCRFYCHVRETLPPQNNIRRKITIHALNRFEGVMFITKRDMEDLRLNCPTCVVRDSLESNVDELIKVCPVQDECFSVAFVGGSNPIKGLSVLLSALEQIIFPIEIHIAGLLSDKDLNRIKNMMSTRENLHFVIDGVVDNIYAVLNKCHVLICPSLSAHQLRPVFEAGYVSIPVITTEFDELAENIVNGYNGITVPLGDASALATEIKKLREEPDYREMLGHNNKLMAEKNKYSNVYEQLIEFIE